MRSLCLALLAAGCTAGAAAQTAPSAPSRAASQTTAPTSSVARAIDAARGGEADGRVEPAAVPQVAVPLKRHVPPNPTAVKPGRAAPVGGSVDEDAARCRASVNAPAECARADRPTRP